MIGFDRSYRLGDLLSLKGDHLGMARLRELVGRHGLGIQLSLLTDDEIIKQFTHLLERGRWRICPHIPPEAKAVASSAFQLETPPEPTPPPRRRSAPPPPVVQAQPENAMFPSSHDAANQARVLKESAATGVPFCEECEKARQQRAAAGHQGPN